MMRGVLPRAALLLTFVLVCAFFGSRTLVAPDSIGLVLAIDQQDVRLHQPPPPGFVLYVWFAQFIDAWIDDPWVALRVIALLALATAAVLTSRLAARAGGGALAGNVALLCFVSSPLVLFHGMTATSFPADALVSALTATLCVGALDRGARTLRGESYLIGLFCGLRAHSMLVALPLWLWALARLPLERRQRIVAIVAWSAGTLCWLVPQVDLTGSLAAFTHASWTAAATTLASAPIGGAWGTLTSHAQTVAVVVVCGLGLARVLFVAIVRAAARPARTSGRSGASTSTTVLVRERAFWILWLAPGVAWTVVCSLPSSGALLGLVPALCVLFASACCTFPGRFGTGMVVAAIVVDIALFFAVPVTELRGIPRAVFGDVQFFHEHTRQALVGDRPDLLRGADLDVNRALFLSGDPMERALAYEMPEMRLLHADVRRSEPLLVYRNRRARAVAETYEVASEVTRIVVVSGRDEFSRAPNPLLGVPWPRQSLDGLEIVRVGAGPIDAWFVPEIRAGEALQVHLVRGLPPPDPSDAALQRAQLSLDEKE